MSDGPKRSSTEAPLVNGVPTATIDPGLKELDGKLTSILKVGSRFADEEGREEEEEGEGKEGKEEQGEEEEEVHADGGENEESPRKPNHNR